MASTDTADPSSQRHRHPEAFETQPIQYLSRTRAWYSTLGYDPYRWASNDQVAFAPLTKPLSECRLGLVTTAAPYQPDKGDQGPGADYNGSAKFFEVYTDRIGALGDQPADVRISHIGYDRHHSKADDSNTWFPVPRLQEAVARGRVGSLTDRFYGVPTVRRARSTIEDHGPRIVDALRADGADIALLVPT